MRSGGVPPRTPLAFPGRAARSPCKRRGFTTTELVVTIVIMGLLAAVAIPRFVSVRGFDSRGFHDEAISVVRYAQKTAIAWRRPVFVCVAAAEIRAGAAAGCATALTHPSKEGGQLVATAPGGVTISPTVDFQFDAIGRLLDSGGIPKADKITLAFASTIAGDPARQIVIEAETGYVHP